STQITLINSNPCQSRIHTTGGCRVADHVDPSGTKKNRGEIVPSKRISPIIAEIDSRAGGQHDVFFSRRRVVVNRWYDASNRLPVQLGEIHLAPGLAAICCF